MAKRELDALAVSALCENLALLLGAGIQLDEAAGLLCEDSAAGPFREAARTMQKALLLGESLSSAVEKTGALPGYAVRMIAAGEKAGRTEPVLNSLARYYASQARLQKKLHSAVVYPAVLLGLMAAILAVLLAWVLPVFTGVYEGLVGDIATSSYGYIRLAYWVGGVALAVTLVLAVLVAQFLNGNFENVFLCLLTLVLFLVPSFIERKIHVDLPDTLEVIILLFIFAAEILGEIQAYYIMFPYWDTMLHTLNGFLCAAIGFALVDILNRSERFSITLSPLFLAITAFCFSMTIGVLWEFFECLMDQLFWLDMQKDTVVHAISSVKLDPTGGNTPTGLGDITDVIVVTADGEQVALGLGGYLDIGLLDTMKDLFVNFAGAVVFSVIGYFYVKSRGRGRFASRFIPKVEPLPETENAGDA